MKSVGALEQDWHMTVVDVTLDVAGNNELGVCGGARNSELGGARWRTNAFAAFAQTGRMTLVGGTPDARGTTEHGASENGGARALRRALTKDPAARWPSMSACSSRSHHRPRSHRGLFAAGAALAVGGMLRRVREDLFA
jgi:hypothetical protein